MAIKPDGSGSMISVLIPAHYITLAQPGPEFRLTQSILSSASLGVFPPNQPPPPNPVPLEVLERVLAGLVDVSLN